MTEEHKKKLADSHLGSRNHNFGKKLSEETRQKMSKAHKKNPVKYWLGKKQASEHIAKRALVNTGKKRPYIEKLSMRGENNPAWKGGITDENHRIRSSIEYKLWRKAVFERDNYICIWCGNKGYVQADHIKPFSDYPELRFAIDNGRTLCVDCHKTTNSYGVHRKDILW